MICSKSKQDPELGKIRSILLKNGYLEHAINSAFKQKLQQLNSNPIHIVKKCPVYLHIPWIGNVLMKFEKQITSAVRRCFFSVETRVIFNTRQLLPATKKDVLAPHHHSNVIYQFVYHYNSRYIGRTSQRLEEQIKQHIPRSIANPPASSNHQSFSCSCKANIRPQQFHESAIGQHLLDNARCALHYNNKKFSILARGRSSFYLSAFEATFIKSTSHLNVVVQSPSLHWGGSKWLINSSRVSSSGDSPSDNSFHFLSLLSNARSHMDSILKPN